MFNKQHVLNICLTSDSGSDSESNSSDLCENTIHLKNSYENETQFKALLKKFKFIKDIKIEENDNCIEDNKWIFNWKSEVFEKSCIKWSYWSKRFDWIREKLWTKFEIFWCNSQSSKNNYYRLLNEEELIQLLQNSPNLRTIVMESNSLKAITKQYLAKLEEIIFYICSDDQ